MVFCGSCKLPVGHITSKLKDATYSKDIARPECQETLKRTKIWDTTCQ